MENLKKKFWIIVFAILLSVALYWLIGRLNNDFSVNDNLNHELEKVKKEEDQVKRSIETDNNLIKKKEMEIEKAKEENREKKDDLLRRIDDFLK